MKSYEVLRQVFKPVGCKNVAQALKLSEGTIHKWFRARGDQGTGRINPLDRVVQLMALPGGEALLVWLCAQAGGRFVPAAQVPPLRPEERAPACHRSVVELGELVSAMGKVLPTGRLTVAEMDALRPVFAQLQTDMERLLQTENGNLKPEDFNCRAGGSPSHAGGSRCRFRLSGGRCGFPHARRRH